MCMYTPISRYKEVDSRTAIQSKNTLQKVSIFKLQEIRRKT